MTELSTATLILAIEAIALETELLTRRIEASSPEIDAEEHLSETVVDLQRALGELGAIYERRRSEEALNLEFDAIVTAGRAKA